MVNFGQGRNFAKVVNGMKHRIDWYLCAGLLGSGAAGLLRQFTEASPLSCFLQGFFTALSVVLLLYGVYRTFRAKPRTD
jgi:hypothetical protein